MDQLESTSPGFIAQLKQTLTQQRYRYATVFVDQFSLYNFVYLQKRVTSQETVMAKQAFEQFAEQHGVKIKHYHADNGRFADNAFIQDCHANRQSLSYCSVNAHFQNGKSERPIRDLQEQTRTSMVYAMNKWRKMVIINLLPYAMKHANDIANATKRKGQELSPLELFSGVQIAPKLRHFHAFGCPNVYVGQCGAERARSTQVEGALKAWCVSWPISQSRPFHSTSFELKDRPRVPSISRQI